MIGAFFDGVRRSLKWIYQWVTVLVAMVSGALWAIPEFFLAFTNVDATPLLPPLPPETVVKITTMTALLKAAIAFFVKRRSERSQGRMDAMFKPEDK